MLAPEREQLIATVIAYATMHPQHHELKGPVSTWTAKQKEAWNLLHPGQQIVDAVIVDDDNDGELASHVNQQEVQLRTDLGGSWVEVQDNRNRWILEHKDHNGDAIEAYTTSEIEAFSDDELNSWQALHPGYHEGVAAPQLPKVREPRTSHRAPGSKLCTRCRPRRRRRTRTAHPPRARRPPPP